MADNDRTRGYRDNEAHRRPRPQVTQQAAGDPLAELARLIGQQNESAPSYRQSGASAPYGAQPQPQGGQTWSRPNPFTQQAEPQRGNDAQWPSSDADDAENPAYAHGQHDPRYGAQPSTRGYREEPSYDAHRASPSYGEAPYAAPRYDDQGYAADPRYDDPRFSDPRYADEQYPDQQYADQRYDDGGTGRYDASGYSEPNFGTPQYGNSSYASDQDGFPQAGGDRGYAGYDNQDGRQPSANPYYMPPPLPRAMPQSEGRAPAKRRGSVVTVLAVLALAVVGTAGAFGYRAMFSGTGNPVPPPVIKADTQPSKVVPATDPNSKPIQDRIGVKTEKVVPRQEEPVQQAAPGQPRVIAPWLAGQSPQSFPPASANIAPTGSTGSTGTQAPGAQPVAAEPKRVRTVPIKPQQQGAEAPGPRSSRSAPAAQPEEPAVADSGTAPLALAPTGSVPPSQARQAARQAHASVTPNTTLASASPFPAPLPGNAAVAPASGGSTASGPYAVQVTSQRSEADAQASYKSLQQQFPSVLGSRQPVIRRADLGERGTYYRAQIPFQSQNEANEFCTSLKSAGGQCVIARN